MHHGLPVMGALEILWVWVYEYVLGPLLLLSLSRLHYFNNFVCQSVTNNRCAPSCGGGAQEKSEGAHQKIFGWHCANVVPCKLLPTPLICMKAAVPWITTKQMHYKKFNWEIVKTGEVKMPPQATGLQPI